MPALPTITSKDLVRVLLRLGFVIDHQKGSHVRLIHVRDSWRRVTVPMHDRDLPKGTLKSILRQAEISVDELIENL